MRRDDDLPQAGPRTSELTGFSEGKIIVVTIGACALLVGVALVLDLGKKPRPTPFLGYDR